jgi:signal transduction histidine kinase
VRKSVIAALTLGVLAAVATFRIADQWTLRAQTIRTAAARANNLALILAAYIQESFVAGDGALRQLTLHSRRIGGPAAPDEDWLPSLASARAGLPGNGSISVVDADGIIRHSTQPAIVGQSRRDDFVFRELANRPTDDYLLSTPFMSLVEPRQYLIPVGRRLTKEDGTFEGVIVATFLAELPRGFLRTVDVGERGSIWAFHPTGFVLFREPSAANPLGQPASSNPLFVEAQRARLPHAVENLIGPEGRNLLVAFRPMTAPPLTVAVALDRWDLLADYRRQVAGALVFFLVLATMLTATLLVLFRQMDAKARVEQALQHAQQAEADQLREANERLEAASRLKDQFLMTVSHELRTPLTAIHGWVRMLITGNISEGRRAAALESIERNARIQTRLIDDLLDVSRVMGGKLQLDIREVDAAEVIQAAIGTMTPAADAKHIRLDARIDPALPRIGADADRLQQIVWNLLSNAVKFTPAGGSVEVRAFLEGADLVISVADSGDGIASAFLPHVFERFRQQDGGTRRKHGGLGLGLAIVRHLTELHGGTVSAESAGEGKGATFTVRLPLAARAPHS